MNKKQKLIYLTDDAIKKLELLKKLGFAVWNASTKNSYILDISKNKKY